MSQKQFLLTLLVAVISAFLGGTFGVWFLMPPSVLTQDEPQRVIEAQEFRVVDEDRNTLAILDGLFGGSLRLTGGDGEVEINSSTSSFIPDESVLPRLVLQPNRIHLRNEEGTRDIQLDRDGVITAKRFVLKDDQGRMRAELRLDFFGPGLALYDEEGKIKTVVEPGRIVLAEDLLSEGPSSRLSISSLMISRDNASADVFIEGGARPVIQLTDKEGFQAVIGSTSTVETRTGKTNQTSAASLILFGKDGTAIWSAP